MEIFRDADVSAQTPGGRRHQTLRNRKPLTPHNHQTPMQAFRQSLKAASNNKINEQSDQTKNTSKSAAYANLTEKENYSALPASTQSFRQNLRGKGGGSKLLGGRRLGSPRDGVLSSRNATSGSFKNTSTGLGPPQRVVPKTPNSLLRSEIGSDDSTEDESFLVSPPPGALWDRLQTSSTGLVVVSPQVATQIHETLSARKENQEKDYSQNQNKSPFFSPPLQPRKLANSTAKKRSNKKSLAPVSFADPISNKRSPWFSLDETETAVLKLDSYGAPAVKTNLFNDSPLQKIPNNSKISSTGSLDVEHATEATQLTEKISLAKTEVTVSPTNAFTPRENSSDIKTGLMDFSHMFSDSKKTRAGPPAHLVDRLQHRSIRSPNNFVSDIKPTESQKRSFHAEKKPSIQDARNRTEILSSVKTESRDNVESGAEKASSTEHKKSETGMMDFTHLFSASKAKRAPPSDLVERLKHSSKKSPIQSGMTGHQKKSSPPTKLRMRQESNLSGASLPDSAKANSRSSSDPSPSSLLALEKRNTKAKGDFHVLKEKSQQAPVETTSIRQRTKTSVDRRGLPLSSDFNARKKDVECNRRNTKKKFSPQTVPNVSIGKIPGKYTAMATPKHGKMTNAPGRITSNSTVSSQAYNESQVCDWAEKQSNTFVNWINYTISPGESDEDKEEDEFRGRSPSFAGLRMLLIHRHQSQLRAKASTIFHGNQMSRVKDTIRGEIGRGRLSIRADRDLYYDLSLRRQVTTLLQSYTTPWLRLGLEVMYGELIGADAGTPVPSKQRTTLGKFIVNRILSDASVLKKYTKGKCKIPSGRFEQQFRAEMRSLVLYRIMLLVFFLDQAKMCNILDKVPRLFVKGSKVKSSREVLLALCRICLSSEGDFIKHLSRIGLKVTYGQDPVDELDLYVHNLATDLRDGTCLARITEITTGQPAKALMSQLRLPSISRLQKLHNLNLALSSLRSCGVVVSKDVNAHHIVDGHREMVLKVMWSIIAHSCMEKLLEDDLVEREIENVQRSNHARRKIQGHVFLDCYEKPSKKAGFPERDPKKVLASLLLRWSQAVCSSFGLNLSNFTTSFADGRALCHLIHYYHPTVLRLDEILPTSTENESLPQADAIRNERMNSLLASQRASELGGIPRMLPHCDSKNPPDEQSMLLCLTYLCSRLMESSKEILASILIQQCYRTYHEKLVEERKKAAALTIVRVWQRHKDRYFMSQRRLYFKAVSVVEAFALANWDRLVQMKKARLRKEVHCCAVQEIQRVFRGAQGRKKCRLLLREKNASITIQSGYRGILATRLANKLRFEHEAVVTIQTFWRRFASQNSYSTISSAVRTIQRCTRGSSARRQMKQREIAALTIQNAWWNFVQNWRFRWAATTIQSLWRGSLARSELVRRIIEEEELNDQAAVVIQSAWRRFSVQVEFQTILFDIITIQSLARKTIAMDHHKTMLYAIVTLQCAARCWSARRRFKTKVRNIKAAIVCQCAVRSWLSNRTIATLRHEGIAATMIQSQWKRHVASVSYIRLRSRIVSAQALSRGSLARHQISLWNKSATRIQSRWREHSWNSRVNASVVAIQKTWRKHSAKTQFSRSLVAIKLIQRHWKVFMARIVLEKEQFAATVIQSTWRGYFAKREFVLDVLEVIFVQGAARRYLAKRAVNQRRIAVHKIQSASRCFLAVKELQRRQRLELDRIECHQAALSIQAAFRQWFQRRSYKKIRRNIIALQAWCRSQIAQRRYRITRSGMVAMQSVVRSHQTRKKLAHRHSNATSIQSYWRSFVTFVRYRTLIGDVITAQSVVRRYCAIQKQNRHHIAATKIQSLVRGIAVRTSLSIYHARAATIQAAFRGYVCRMAYNVEIVNVVIIQSLARRWLAIQMKGKQVRAALKIQSLARQRASKRIASIRLQREKTTQSWNCMARQLQSAYRGHRARKHVESLRLAAVLIQSEFRKYLAIKKFRNQQRGAILIQSLARRLIASKTVARMILAVVTIQACARKLLARRTLNILQREQNLWYRKEQSSTHIQSIWRGYTARKTASKHSAARKIQKTWRCFVTHIDYLVQVMSVLSIQAQVRRHLAMNEYKRKYRSVENIQALARGLAVSYKVRKKNEAATKIQAAYRSFVNRLAFGVKQWAAIEVQRMARGFYARLNLEIEHYAATEIQRIWRGFDQNIEYTSLLLGALKVQSSVRRHIATKEYRRLRQIRHQKASVIQNQYRVHMKRQKMSVAARKIQSCFREYLARWRANMLNRATIRLQAAFRARFVRQTRAKAIINISHRVTRANKRAQEDPTQSLGCRTSGALAVLQTSTSLAEIMDAVKTLELATRFSVDCCEVFTNANAAKILLDLIRACNRSLPHVELVHWILLILENVGQHDSCLKGFADCKSAEVFLDKVQMFRDKDGIFCLSVSLLQRIVDDDQDVKDFCGNHEHLKRLKGIYKLSLRKARPAAASAKTKNKSGNKYERREIFNRSEALKVLGELIDFVQKPSISPSRVFQKKHFF